MVNRTHISLKKNFVFNVISTLVNILYPLISFSYISRLLGPELLGRINMATSIAIYFSLLASVGIPLYGTREIARARSDKKQLNKTFSELIYINIITALIAFGLYLGCFFYFKKIRSDALLFNIASIYIFTNCITIDWFFQGIEDFGSTLFRNFILKAISIFVIILLVQKKEDYLTFVCIGVSIPAIYNLWGLYSSRKYVKLTFKGIRLKDHLKPIAILAAAGICTSAYTYLDGVILGFLAGNHSLGIYTAAIKIVRTLFVIIIAITTSVIPRLSHYFESGKILDYSILSQKSIYTIQFICLPLYFIVWSVAPHLVKVLAGPQFSEAYITLRIAILLIPLSGITHFIGLQILLPQGKELPLLISGIVGLFLNVIFNFLLIPILKENGAALAAVATELGALFVFLKITAKDQLLFKIFDSRVMNYLIIAFLSGLISYFFSTIIQNDFVAIVIAPILGATIYLGLLKIKKDPIAEEFLELGLNKLRISLNY